MSDLNLSKMTLKDLCSEVLVSWNICDKLYKFLMEGLGGMGSDGRT